MKMSNEDYLSYEEQQLNQLKVSMMNIEATQVLLKWLDGKIKRKKKK